MRTSIERRFRARAAIVIIGLAPAAFGCELIAGVDRTKIGETGGSGGSGGTGGTGGAPECAAPADCAQPSDECMTATCDGGKCGVMAVADGTPLKMQTTGDCKTKQCTAGMAADVDDDTDVSDDSNPC